jgi:predicted site-specific integrase-resolvase
MKLSEWAKKQGVSYRTTWRWFKAGILPIPAKQLSNGTIILSELEEPPRIVAIYARVSSSDQKKDLDRQVARLVTFANEKGLSISKTVTEIGSGLNGHRPKLMKLLADKSIGVVLVEHRDRLMRFGAEYVESALASEGRKLFVADQGELKDDLVQDMIEVLTSFCVRLYGRRSAKNKAKKALEVIQNEN